MHESSEHPARPASNFEPGARIEADALDALLTQVGALKDRAAFRELFLRLGPAVKGVAMRQGADAATAEELAQETFLTIWRKAANFSPERGTASGWIFAIARNLRIDRLRAQPAWQELTDEMQEESGDDPSPEDAVYSKQIQTRVRSVLRTLPVEQHEVVRLAYDEGLTHTEIAERLSLPLGTVKTRLNLAYRKIREGVQGFR